MVKTEQKLNTNGNARAKWGWDHESEVAILACCLLDPRSIKVALSLVPPEDFHNDRHRWIYKGMLSINGNGQAPTALNIRDWLKINAPAHQDLQYLARLTDLFPIVTELAGYCRLVKEHANRRKLYDIMKDAQTRLAASEDAVEIAQRAITAAGRIEGQVKIRSVGDTIDDTLSLWSRLQENRAGAPRWYLPEMDRLLGPLHGAQAIIVAGAANSGKTTFLWTQAVKWAIAGHQVAFLSLEMTAAQMNARLVIYDSHVNPLHLPGDKQYIAKDAMERFRNIGLYTDDTPHTAATLFPSIRRHISAGCKIIFIDYLGRVGGRGKENLNNHLGMVMHEIKTLANEFGSDIITGAQLNRDSRKEQRPPELWDLRDSGNIEQESDLVVFIDRKDWRDENEHAVFNVKKNRHGITGAFDVGWDPQSKVFTNRETY